MDILPLTQGWSPRATHPFGHTDCLQDGWVTYASPVLVILGVLLELREKVSFFPARLTWEDGSSCPLVGRARWCWGHQRGTENERMKLNGRGQKWAVKRNRPDDRCEHGKPDLC